MPDFVNLQTSHLFSMLARKGNLPDAIFLELEMQAKLFLERIANGKPAVLKAGNVFLKMETGLRKWLFAFASLFTGRTSE